MTDFPLDSFKEAAPHLRRPFAPNALKWKLQTAKMLVAYVDVRTVIARLNLVVPHLWETRFEPWGERVDTNLLICHLTIDGLTRSDIGTGSKMEPQKGAYSDALKRAAVHFGLGHSIYAMKRVYLSDLPAKARGDGKSVTPEAERVLRAGYEKWLASDRGKHFGEALDHGEEADSVGDPDAEPVAEQPNLELAAARADAEQTYAGQNGAVRKKIPPGRFKAELDAASDVGAVEKLMERVAKAAA